MDLRSFLGILRPKIPYAKDTSETQELSVPSKVTFLWSDGRLSDVSIGKGDRVKTGQNLAKDGKGPFVSTVSGSVEEISSFKGPDGEDSTAVTIFTDPQDSFDPSLKTIEDFTKAESSELRVAINRAGFSSLNPASSDPQNIPGVDTLIVSAIDQDPLSIVNQQSFRDHPDLIKDSVDLLTRATEASHSFLAIPDHFSDFDAAGVTVARVPAVYPNGLPEILARKLGSGALIQEKNGKIVGNTRVVGVEEALSMLSCLKNGMPLMEKTVTFSYGRGGRLRNFRVRIGTPVAEILKESKVEVETNGKLIMNGIMRGYSCFSDEQPIGPTTDSIHVQPASEVFYFQDAPCINCGKCNAICPVRLEVNLLGRLSEYGFFEKCSQLGVENCIQCGMCAYVCPAHRPLVQLISHAQHVIQTQGVEKPSSMEEAVACNACGPTCPAIRLFETASREDDDRKD